LRNVVGKEKRLQNVGVHEHQALVLVNYGNASGSDVLALAYEIKISVIKTFGIDLTEEVNILLNTVSISVSIRTRPYL